MAEADTGATSEASMSEDRRATQAQELTKGNCSMRPMPTTLYDRARAEAEYGVKFPGQPLPIQFRAAPVSSSTRPDRQTEGKDSGAVLIHQAIPDVEVTLPRPNLEHAGARELAVIQALRRKQPPYVANGFSYQRLDDLLRDYEEDE